MRKKCFIFFLLVLLPGICAYAEETGLYSGITSTAEFNYRPEYVPMNYSHNKLFEDIKVSAVSGAAFGFLYSLLYVYADKAVKQETLSPDLGGVEDNKMTYITWAGIFGVANTLFNVIFFYDYGNEEEKDAEKKRKE